MAPHQLHRGFLTSFGGSATTLCIKPTFHRLENKNSTHPPLLVLAVIPMHSKSLQTTPKPTFSHKTLCLCKVKCQQFRLNSFQGCFGKLKIQKTNVNSTPVTNISGKINLKNCVKNEKYFNGWDRALSSDVGALSLKGDAKTITLYSPALTFLIARSWGDQFNVRHCHKHF